MQLIAFILLAVAIYGRTAHGLSQELRDHALKLHNDYRMNVPNACQMERMQYDLELERQATVWANKCVFEHEIIKGRGENLAWNSAKGPETDLMTKAAKAWYDEVHLYSYGQYSCGSACHYTQMVWDKTNKVGCATKRCSYLTYAYADAWYFVCFYSPAGNMNGEKPYQTSCSTPCKENQVEDSDGLCIDEGNEEENGNETEEGTNEGNGEEETGNETGEEPTNEGNGEEVTGDETGEEPTNEGNGEEVTGDETGEEPTNEGNEEGEEEEEEETETETLEETTTTALPTAAATETTTEEGNEEGEEETETEPPEEPTTEQPCEDKNTSCEHWAKWGECHKNPGYMDIYCRLACDICGNECKDVHGHCASWAADDQCAKNPDYMHRYCKLSCNVC